MNRNLFFSRHQKLTRSLKKFIQDYETELNREIFEAFLENLDQELQYALTEISKKSEGPLRAEQLQRLVDDAITEGAHMESSCQKGCSARCHMEVEITNYEAEALFQLVQKGHKIDRSRLQTQSQRQLQDPQWREGVRNPSNRCVFLDEQGACGIYELRPVMCRRHSVTSPAKNCKTLNEKIEIRYFPKVDLLISAANEDPNLKIGPLAKMLEMQLLASKDH